MKSTLGMVLFLVALGVIVDIGMGCSPSAEVRAANVAVNLGYDADLVRCKKLGKEAGSFAVFEACEKAASRRLCSENPALRDAWARCAEVMP